MSKKQLHDGPEGLAGLQVFLKLSIEEKTDTFRWHEDSEHTFMTIYATAAFEKHIREMPEREKSEDST